MTKITFLSVWVLGLFLSAVSFGAQEKEEGGAKETIVETSQPASVETNEKNTDKKVATKETIQPLRALSKVETEIMQPLQKELPAQKKKVADVPEAAGAVVEGLQSREEEETAAPTAQAEVKEETATESSVAVTEAEKGATTSQDETKKDEEKAEEPAKAAEPTLAPDEIMGIDTVDLEDPQGNWLYKRVWWERAEAKYEKIRAAVTSVMEKRTYFFAKRAEIDKTVLDPFYIKIGLSQGELNELLSELIAKMEKELKEKEDAQLLERLESDKQELEQLRSEVQDVMRKDEEVEKAILTLVDQINNLRNYEQQAWQDFKDIARVLDDKKAREHFYKVDGAWRNVQELQRYVEGDFSSGFDKLVEQISQKVQNVDRAVQALKERGIELKRRVVEQTEPQEEEPQPGFFTRFIVHPVMSFVRTVWNIITWPIRTLFGIGTAQPEKEEVAERVGSEPEEQEVEAIAEESKETPVAREIREPKAVTVQDVAPSAEEPSADESQVSAREGAEPGVADILDLGDVDESEASEKPESD